MKYIVIMIIPDFAYQMKTVTIMFNGNESWYYISLLPVEEIIIAILEYQLSLE